MENLGDVNNIFTYYKPLGATVVSDQFDDFYCTIKVSWKLSIQSEKSYIRIISRELTEGKWDETFCIQYTGSHKHSQHNREGRHTSHEKDFPKRIKGANTVVSVLVYKGMSVKQ